MMVLFFWTNRNMPRTEWGAGETKKGSDPSSGEQWGPQWRRPTIEALHLTGTLTYLSNQLKPVSCFQPTFLAQVSLPPSCCTPCSFSYVSLFHASKPLYELLSPWEILSYLSKVTSVHLMKPSESSFHHLLQEAFPDPAAGLRATSARAHSTLLGSSYSTVRSLPTRISLPHLSWVSCICVPRSSMVWQPGKTCLITSGGHRAQQVDTAVCPGAGRPHHVQYAQEPSLANFLTATAFTASSAIPLLIAGEEERAAKGDGECSSLKGESQDPWHGTLEHPNGEERQRVCMLPGSGPMCGALYMRFATIPLKVGTTPRAHPVTNTEQEISRTYP